MAVVTDSTASLPDDRVREHRVAVVPLHVVLGRRTGAEGRQVSPLDAAAALRERRVEVITSRPTPAGFAAAYRATGAERVVSVHLSSSLSGTGDSRLLGAREVADDGIRVRVVDSRTIAMGLGFAGLAAARAGRAAVGLDEVAAVARRTAARSSLLFYVDTLEHLRRGGRLGAATALLGTALAVKPLLHMVDGAHAPLEKVRTSARALARLEDLAVGAAAVGPVDVAVHHHAAPERAAALADRLRARLPGLLSLHVTVVGAVVGAYVGAGLLGVVVSPR